MRRREFSMAVGTLAALGRVGLARAAVGHRVTIVPVGAVSALEKGVVERALSTFYALELVVAPAESLPKAAFYAPRARYRAEKLLAHLERGADPASTRVLGLLSVDISTTKGSFEDFGILGLASIDGRVGVLSSFRCRRRAKNAEQVAHRLGKTAVHELGHTFGLEHCKNYGCLMEDGQGSVLTTDHEYDLCAECRAKLDAGRWLVSPPREPPWPRPSPP
jgi:archaemetzincin